MIPLLAGTAAAALVVAAAHQGRWGPPRRSPLVGSSVQAAASAPPWLAEACRQLGWAPDLRRLWGLTRATALVATAVTAGLWGIAGILVAGAGCWAAPRALAPMLRRRRLTERDRQLPDALERVAAAMRAGARPGPALAEVSADLPAPLGDELRRAVLALDHGDDLPTVLDRWAAQPGASPAVVLAASALGLGALAGGQVARTVDRVAATLRERRQLQAEVRALATQARSSAWLLAAAPVGFAGLVATLEPGVVSFLLTTPPGLACLSLGLTLDAMGVSWMARIVRGAT